MERSTFVTAHAADESLRLCIGLKIDFNDGLDTVYWTDASSIVKWSGGQSYTPKNLQITGLGFRSLEDDTGFSFDLGDADGAIAAMILGSVKMAGTVVTPVEFWFESTNVTNIADGYVYYGEYRIAKVVTNRRDDRMIARFTCTPRYDLDMASGVWFWAAAKCPFVFKDSNCAATGAATSCQRTFTDCSATDKVDPPAAGGNRVRFGGERWLPADGTVIEFGDGAYTIRTQERRLAAAGQVLR
jgi:hypothetical protein